MAPLHDLVQTSAVAWNADLERSVLGTGDPHEVARLIESYVGERLGHEVIDGIFYEPGVGIVAGVVLDDRREVVLKVHRWRVTIERLQAVQQVQAHLAASGLPAPEPVDAPAPLGDGLAVIESYRPGGRVDGHDEAVGTEVARQLHRFVATAAELGPLDVGRPAIEEPLPGSLYPEPHSVRFDFAATAAGAEWIDDVARAVRPRVAASALPRTLGHLDWRVQNLGFDDRRVVAIYDWDSLVLASEPYIVGVNAGQFCIDWRDTTRLVPLPSIDEMRRFVSDYEQARGRTFDEAERSLLEDANLQLLAYAARCQHSDVSLYPELGGTDDNGWPALLRERMVTPLFSSARG